MEVPSQGQGHKHFSTKAVNQEVISFQTKPFYGWDDTTAFCIILSVSLNKAPIFCRGHHLSQNHQGHQSYVALL